jgi:DNA repair protein RadD
MPLRDYQQEALDALENYIAIEDGNPLVVMPTGSGKSHVIADFVLHMNEQKKQKTLIVSHVKEILFQNYEKLQDAWPYGDIGLYGNSLKSRDTDNDIIYAQLQSVWNKVDELPLFDLLTIDEAPSCSKGRRGNVSLSCCCFKRTQPKSKSNWLYCNPLSLELWNVNRGKGIYF